MRRSGARCCARCRLPATAAAAALLPAGAGLLAAAQPGCLPLLRRFKGLTAEDMLVYQCIQGAGNMGALRCAALRGLLGRQAM